MIVPEDSDFHPQDGTVANWAETIGFWFAIPEEKIFGNIYVLARPNVGATTSSINVIQGICRLPFEADFTDPQMHVPCPESMAQFSLTSGLQVDVTKPPENYNFRYQSNNGECGMRLELIGSMPAWDPHDPNENPLLTRATDESADLGLGDAWSTGHLDFIGRVTGELELRGQRYAVNSMGGMDRSWGPRAEIGEKAISYIHIPFDEDFGIHLVMALDLEDGRAVYGPLRFGYVYDHGEVHGIVEAAMTGNTVDLLPTDNEIAVTDARGRRFLLRGQAVAAAPWYSFIPAYVTFQGLMRYEFDGRVAHGLMADTWGIEFLADRTSRHGTRTPPT